MINEPVKIINKTKFDFQYLIVLKLIYYMTLLLFISQWESIVTSWHWLVNMLVYLFSLKWTSFYTLIPEPRPCLQCRNTELFPSWLRQPQTSNLRKKGIRSLENIYQPSYKTASDQAALYWVAKDQMASDQSLSTYKKVFIVCSARFFLKECFFFCTVNDKLWFLESERAATLRCFQFFVFF